MSELIEENNYIKKIPSMPSLVEKTFEIIREGGNFVEDLTSEISKYKEVEEIILRLANSKYFSFGQEIKTLQKAIMFLGVMRTKNIVLALSLIDMYCPNGYKDFFKHSLMCAITSKVLAEQQKTINPDDAFAIGFLHDIGKTILYRNIENDFEKTKNSIDADIIEEENSAFQTNHCAIGSTILKKWHLPNIVVDCVRYHHAPTLSALPGVCGLIHIADVVSSEGNFEDKLGNMPMRLGINSLEPKSLNLMARTKAEALMEMIKLI